MPQLAVESGVCGSLKAEEVAAGLALPKDFSMRFASG
jgi:hypothetical protein